MIENEILAIVQLARFLGDQWQRWRAKRSPGLPPPAKLKQLEERVKELEEDAAGGSAIEIRADIINIVRDGQVSQISAERDNIEYVFRKAADDLGDESVPNAETEPEFRDSFADGVLNAGSDEVRDMLARILAGKIREPGSVSVRTLNILREMDQEVAQLFRTLCSLSLLRQPKRPLVTVPILAEEGGLRSLRKYGIDYDPLLILSEYGLIVADYTTNSDYRGTIGIPMSTDAFLQIHPFEFQHKWWVLWPKRGYEHLLSNEEYELLGVLFSRAGSELRPHVAREPAVEYARDLAAFFEEKGLEMQERSGPGPWKFTPLSD